MPTILRRFAILAAMICTAAIAHAQAVKTARLTSTSPDHAAANPADVVPERDRLWQQAQDLAAANDWRGAIERGQAALALANKNIDDDSRRACRILESLCFWHTKLREFPAALAAAHELVKRQTAIGGARHWQTLEANRNLATVERMSRLNDAEWQRFIEADDLCRRAVEIQNRGDHAAALKLVEQALPAYLELFGHQHRLSENCLSNELTCQMALGHYREAEPSAKALVELDVNERNTIDPRRVERLKQIAWYEESTGNPTAAETALREVAVLQSAITGADHPDTIRARAEVGRICTVNKKFAESRAILTDALEAQRKLLGDYALPIAATTQALGMLESEQGNFAEAEKLLTESIATFQKLAGENHLVTASALNALGKLYLRTGRFQESNEALLRSFAICQKTLGDQHPVIAKVLDNLARLYEMNRETGSARQARLFCLRIAEQSYGEMNVLTADALEKTGGAYIDMNDFDLAKGYLLRALEVRRKLLGEEHPDTASVLSHLGYVNLGDPDRAEPLFVQALAIIEKTLGPETLEASRIHERMALLYQTKSQFADADVHYRQALAIVQKVLEVDHFANGVIKMGLAQTMLSRGNAQEAQQLIGEALTIYERTLKYNDPRWFDPLGIAAKINLAAGDAAKAEQLLSRGLHISRLRMEMTGGFESERQRMVQMASMRSMLNLYLSLPPMLATEGTAVYPHVLLWKGAIATRQWQDRQHISEDTAPLTAELQQLGRRLAALSLSVPEPSKRDEWSDNINALKLRKEALEQQLAVYSDKLRDPEEDLRTADIRKALSPGEALIDILQYTHTSFGEKDGKLQPRYVAFVIRPFRETQRIELGDADPINEATQKWGKTRGFRPDPGKPDWTAKVNDLVWSKLRPWVSDCETLLISPDSTLSQYAWGVLPGRTPDRYLIEDYEIGMVPVAQLMAARMKANPRANSQASPNDHSLLLVGDITYDRDSAPRNELRPNRSGLNFTPLKGAAAEVHALRDRFVARFPGRKVDLLDKSSATEEAFWREAPRHRAIHIATHGFFAPASVKAAIAAQASSDGTPIQPQAPISLFDVGILNGLALTGANAGVSSDGSEDGILTAAEIATMDLRNVEIAVLSGCETGLGDIRAGEGLFGLQRALQIAGVEASIGSLWTVPDEKTNLLMQRFYANLWDKKLSKLAALREAQLWLLNTGGSTAPTPANSPAKRLSPHYWAAFTVSGDWR